MRNVNSALLAGSGSRIPTLPGDIYLLATRELHTPVYVPLRVIEAIIRREAGW